MGHPIGSPNTNLILDCRIYKLEFPDRRVEEYSINIIIENILDLVSNNDWDASIFDEVISVKKGHNAINKGPGAHVKVNGMKMPIITTKGWSVQVRWKDGSISWLPLSLVKSSNPVDLTECIESNNFSNEPASNWWVRQTLAKRNRIITRIKTKNNKVKIKFGVRVPQMVEEAIGLDRKNRDILWQEVIAKEINNSRIAFQVLDHGERPSISYKEITCHLIFDV